MSQVQVAQTDDQIAACFEVMQQLRPELIADQFVARVRDQMSEGYHLAFLTTDAGETACVAGYRYGTNLAWDRFMYVDDLVTEERVRSDGYGQVMLRWLIEEARARGCDRLHLDSGVQRFAAHRFYLKMGFDITSHHFAMRL